MHGCHSYHIPGRSLSFLICLRACRTAGASPLLFEVTFRLKNPDDWDDKAFDVNAVFS